MKRLGYRAIDLIVDHYESVPEKPLTGVGDPDDLRSLLVEPLPETGTSPEALLDLVSKKVLSQTLPVDHPRFLAFVPGPSNFLGVLGDLLASGFNVFAGTWLEASGPAQVELVTLEWIRTCVGLPEGAGGIFVSGGSMANVTGLAVARHKKLGGPDSNAVVYCSEHTHSSVERGLDFLGFSSEQLVKIPSDPRFRLDPRLLIERVRDDEKAGRRPFCVVASAGTTSTGTVDDLEAIHQICRDRGLWMHVDGSYGAAAALSRNARIHLRGLEFADSLSLDPHKWLFQPYEIGCTLVRDRRWLKETFHIMPPYLVDAEGDERRFNFSEHGVQLTRSFRALKLWLSLKAFGREAFEDLIDRGLSLAEETQTRLESRAAWRVVTPAQMGTLTFRFESPRLDPESSNRLHRELSRDLLQSGYAFLSTTHLLGNTVLRLCTINPRTTLEDLETTLDRLEILARSWIDTHSRP